MVFGPAGQRGNLEVVSAASDYVERPSRCDVNDGRNVQSLNNLSEWRFRPVCRLIDAAENEAVALIEQRIGAVEAGVVTILRREGGLQSVESSIACDHV